MTATVERARDAFARQAWAEASTAFEAAAEETPLTPADNECRAVAAYLVGADDASGVAWEAAHRTASAAGDAAEAARFAFWLAFCLMLRGRMAPARGWLSRAERLVDTAGEDCSAVGYLLVPGLLTALADGDATRARDLAVRATALGDRLGDADLRALGTLGHGQARIAMGDAASGTALLDEVMVSVTSGEVGPITSGIVYCAVILECMQLFDVRRATEWTDALERWSAAQPDLVPYRGQCLVHRSQIQQAAGTWPDALSSAADARRRLTDPPHPALGRACYQEAELHRLVGAFEEADAEYRQASRHGYHPMPGLALLRLAEGEGAAAATSIGRTLEEVRRPLERPALLAAAVDILVATGNLAGARAAAEELAAIAATSPSVLLRAMASQAMGTALVAGGDSAAAMVELRAAGEAWRSLQMPYEGARTAVLRATACTALGDPAAAALELDDARAAFVALGAGPDLDRLTAVAGSVGASGTRLSLREREVLALVAAGRTNREIAAQLVISQHTVSRHLENIFAKLGVTTRAAAIAHVYEQHLL
jgi:DNA-binding CsgD family transcriptional regulator